MAGQSVAEQPPRLQGAAFGKGPLSGHDGYDAHDAGDDDGDADDDQYCSITAVGLINVFALHMSRH